jgi:hypothetical protein
MAGARITRRGHAGLTDEAAGRQRQGGDARGGEDGAHAHPRRNVAVGDRFERRPAGSYARAVY